MFLIHDTIDDRQASGHGESPLIITFVMKNLQQNPPSEFLWSGADLFLTTLLLTPDKSKVQMFPV